MELNNISRKKGANRTTKRLGRGTGSGTGKTSGKGHKGHRARAGYHAKPFFEGGQMPLYRVLGKSGFTNLFKKSYMLLNLDDLERLGWEKVDLPTLKEKKLVSKQIERLKILGRGSLSKAVEVHAHKASKTAMEAIEKAKGKLVIVPEREVYIRKRKTEGK